MINKLILLLGLLLSCSTASAQSNQVYTGTYARGLLSLDTYTAGPVVGFESILQNKTVIGLKTGMLLSNSAHDRPGRWRLLEQILLIQPEIKFYKNTPFQGFYFGAHGSYNRYQHMLREQDTREKLSIVVTDISDSFFGFGVDMGFQTAVSKRLNFGVGVSGDLFFNATRFEEGDLGFGLGAQIGYKF